MQFLSNSVKYVRNTCIRSILLFYFDVVNSLRVVYESKTFFFCNPGISPHKNTVVLLIVINVCAVA